MRTLAGMKSNQLILNCRLVFEERGKLDSIRRKTSRRGEENPRTQATRDAKSERRVLSQLGFPRSLLFSPFFSLKESGRVLNGEKINSGLVLVVLVFYDMVQAHSIRCCEIITAAIETAFSQKKPQMCTSNKL